MGSQRRYVHSAIASATIRVAGAPAHGSPIIVPHRVIRTKLISRHARTRDNIGHVKLIRPDIQRRSRRIWAAIAASAVLAVGGTAPANAADTVITFTVTGADLIIVVPTSLTFGAVQVGTTLTGQMQVTVEDHRGLTPATWTAFVSSTNFITGGGTPPETISNSNIRYWSGPATNVVGTGTPVPGQLTEAQAVVMDVTNVAFGFTDGSGGNEVTWHPTGILQVPSTAQAGPYTGTVTHTVA